MYNRAIQAVLFILAVTIMVVPFPCQNASSAGNEKDTTTYNLYFGDLHTHTSYSDGTGTPWEAYEAAIDAGADFMAVTDHVPVWNAYYAWTATEEEWADTLSAADHYTSNSFVAMAGYEAWLLAGIGEINVFNSRDLPPGPLLNRLERLPVFYDWLVQQGAVGQFNHPVYYSDNFLNYSYYNEFRDQGMGVLENLRNADYESSYIMALDTGWHIMPAANSDTHNANWISGSEVRTVLLAPSLTPENLYDAMKANRGYATQDKNLQVHYTLNGAIMGSVLSPTGTYEVSVQLSDPDGAEDAIKLVEIVSDGGEVVASLNVNSTTVEYTTTLTSDSAHYFYVRVTTASDRSGEEGVTAWTAPVWTGN
ncbi:MAG: CehA/McbA family metallohydrolase [Methanobacteriota archaeon]|nr:MAG: CehA/McbA family metallohydrolase [Euryarchaeota archaeon]